MQPIFLLSDDEELLVNVDNIAYFAVQFLTDEDAEDKAIVGWCVTGFLKQKDVWVRMFTAPTQEQCKVYLIRAHKGMQQTN